MKVVAWMYSAVACSVKYGVRWSISTPVAHRLLSINLPSVGWMVVLMVSRPWLFCCMLVMVGVWLWKLDLGSDVCLVRDLRSIYSDVCAPIVVAVEKLLVWAFVDDGYRSLNLYDLSSPVFMSEMMWILDLCAFTVWIEVLRVESVLDLFDVALMVAWFCMLSSPVFMSKMMWILDLFAFLVWIDVLSG
ncbi:hypothetical protein QVD17_19389 [Tagetes erecta]|uniref:Uncharacterized protein n=1 Tax=Tagetes erecta TaxID=13708 RepID=A0AAD8KPM3_TARER|nr:hypothetical protein QVD17_19389 [Tagetes erecta]